MFPALAIPFGQADAKVHVVWFKYIKYPVMHSLQEDPLVHDLHPLMQI